LLVDDKGSGLPRMCIWILGEKIMISGGVGLAERNAGLRRVFFKEGHHGDEGY